MVVSLLPPLTLSSSSHSVAENESGTNLVLSNSASFSYFPSNELTGLSGPNHAVLETLSAV